jgi:dTMP kinase
LFIAFEGIDGAGSTTQAERLRTWMVRRGMEAYLTKEPSDGPIGSQIRLALSGRIEIDPITLALLFAADRIDHVVRDVEPKRELGVNVITDRYLLSSLAYQALDAERQWISSINQAAPPADLTILVDTPAEIGSRRIQRHRWHVELYEDLDRLSRVRTNYLDLARTLQEHGHPIAIVDGSPREQDVHKEILKVVQRHLSSPTAVATPKNQMALWSDAASQG